MPVGLPTGASFCEVQFLTRENEFGSAGRRF
jgi:hypothetical protein